MAGGWSSGIDEGRRESAAAVGREVARRASDPQRIAAALAAAPAQTQFPQTLSWAPHRIADGDAGLALMCAYLDDCAPGEGWDVTGHGFVAAAARGAEGAPELPASTFTGLGGVCFATAALSREGSRYERLLTNLDGALRPLAVEAAQGYDVISGASGTTAYLVDHDPHGVLPRVLRSLRTLGEAVNGSAGWDCGLAHGVPGPLAALSIALRGGVEVEGQTEAVRALADWLVAHRCDDGWGVNWPSAIPAEPEEPVPSRSAWCYGSPGVARALWLAGVALDDVALRDLAVEAILAVRRRPLEARAIDSPTFCHGVAGLLQIVLRFANDTGEPELSAFAGELLDQLLAAYEPDRLLGYASLEPGGNPVDRAGLLDGSAGVAMVLLAAASDVDPSWDRLFLLS